MAIVIRYNKRKLKKFMKKNLPWFQLSKSKTIALQFPSILRFITEPSFATVYFTYVKIFSISFISVFIAIIILFQLSVMARNLKIVQSLKGERTAIIKTISYWQQISGQYQNY